MNHTREELVPRTISFDNFSSHKNIATKNKLRYEVLEKYGSTCRYCGFKYEKYLILITKPELDTCCRFCFHITRLNMGNHKEIKLYDSSISQYEIVNATINFIRTNKYIPHPIDIDKNVKKVPISVLEFINIIINKNGIPIELTNYKIFMSKRMDITFIMSNFKSISLFIDEDSQDSTCSTSAKIPLSDKPSQEYFDQIFNSINLCHHNI